MIEFKYKLQIIKKIKIRKNFLNYLDSSSYKLHKNKFSRSCIRKRYLFLMQSSYLIINNEQRFNAFANSRC